MCTGPMFQLNKGEKMNTCYVGYHMRSVGSNQVKKALTKIKKHDKVGGC